jgi:oligopeptide/dipeptide ABC transporter ATP-binding protein
MSDREKHEIAISVQGLSVHFAQRGGIAAKLAGRGGPVRAVQDVDLDVRRGEILGIIGESGSGKTTLGRAMIGMQKATEGRVLLGEVDVSTARGRVLRRLRKRLQMVFQDPHAALNPTMTIGQAIGHPVQIHFPNLNSSERGARIIEAMHRVDLLPTGRFLDRRPKDLSGGQKQRAVIGRAIASEPEIVVADEPVSMLDTSVRAKILQLLLDLKRDLQLTVVYVTHDLASARYVCDRVAIMYLGRIIEIGTAEEIFRNPQHPYTQALIATIPEADPAAARHHNAPPRGEVPDAADPPKGCSFHPRCPVAFDACGWEPRDLRFVLEQRWATVAPQQFERERDAFPDLERLRTGPGASLVLAPRHGTSAKDLLDIVESIRRDSPDEPFFRGVSALRVSEGKVVMSFTEGKRPELRASGGSTVACHAIGFEPVPVSISVRS